MALGGPKNYTGKDMRKAHENMDLKDEHFDHVRNHLADSLSECGANESQVKTVISVVETLRDDVLNR